MSNGTVTVSVGCKLPAGLILEMGTPGEEDYKRISIIGRNGPNDGHGRLAGCVVTAECGITFGVPKDFIEAWLEKHKKLDAVRNGLVFAMPANHAEPHAKAIVELKTGFEQIVPPKNANGLHTAKDD